jgi:hypothetical protein
LENGDPLENNSNFGAFPYTLNGFTYNLQDLVTLPYFGAPAEHVGERRVHVPRRIADGVPERRVVVHCSFVRDPLREKRVFCDGENVGFTFFESHFGNGFQFCCVSLW